MIYHSRKVSLHQDGGFHEYGDKDQLIISFVAENPKPVSLSHPSLLNLSIQSILPITPPLSNETTSTSFDMRLR